MLTIQPESNFGDAICRELNSNAAGHRRWQTFEFAVAWANQRGVESIVESARVFLADGGCIRATVGLDFSSTSYEGLVRLLELETSGAAITTHVFFDENRACTFHPKLFLFSNGEQARLFVGSNNMTGAGLTTNVEAALGVDGALDDETVRAARQTLATWRDEITDRRVRRLTRDFLEQLRDRGYVRTEQELRAQRSSDAASGPSRGEPLFGRSTARTPDPVRESSARGSGGQRAASSNRGEVLLMRLRPRRDGAQVQISMKVVEASFIRGAERVVSAADNSSRPIGYNYTYRDGERRRNTARFEAPEMEGMTNPVARFQWVNDGYAESGARVLQYELFDAATNQEGARILERLSAGITTPPVTDLQRLGQEQTVLSKANREQAQWYRLDQA